MHQVNHLIKERALAAGTVMLDVRRAIGKVFWAAEKVDEPACIWRNEHRHERLQKLVAEIEATLEDIRMEARLAQGEAIAWQVGARRWLISAQEDDKSLLITLREDVPAGRSLFVRCAFSVPSDLSLLGARPPHWLLEAKNGDNDSVALSPDSLQDGLRRLLLQIEEEDLIPVAGQAVS